MSLFSTATGDTPCTASKGLIKHGFFARFCNLSSFVGVITFPIAIRNFIFLCQGESSVMEHAGRTAIKLVLNQNLSVRRVTKATISGTKRKE
jgi:hypothetical protein